MADSRLVAPLAAALDVMDGSKEDQADPVADPADPALKMSTTLR